MTIHTKPIHLPTIDFSRFYGSADERAAFIKELTRVLHDHGFFYLTGHGVPQSLIDDVLAASKRFFALPEADKLSIEMVRSPHFRGYNRAGYERTRGEQDWREQLDVNTEGEPVADSAEAPWNRLYGPNQWPEALPELKPLLLRYQAEVTRIGIDVLKAIALSLGQPENAFADIYEPSPSQLLKIIRYPGREAAGSDQGVGAHKDGGFLTLLLQDDNRGLQVEYDGSWVNVDPIPGTLVVNIGELLELASNGYLRATVHRVVTPPAGVERISVPFFFSARLDATIPLLNLPEELASEARGPASDPDNPLFRDVGTNVLKSRLRSHPDVARRHYADLLEPGAVRP